MNALPSFDPPQHPPQRRKSPVLQQPLELAAKPKSSPLNPQPRSSATARVKANPAYAHRRQGLEVVTKLVTYSTLSVFGIITLVNSIGYNWSQQQKLQHLETELKGAKVRTEKINSNFTRAFAPESQQNMMQENSYKIAPDRLEVYLVNPNSNRPVPNPTSK
ncbi:MAG: hypothetical protein LH613_06690 [Chamaesiphon sp.]|nr:hypothetical protein [Chamaesiphon sp.]